MQRGCRAKATSSSARPTLNSWRTWLRSKVMLCSLAGGRFSCSAEGLKAGDGGCKLAGGGFHWVQVQSQLLVPVEFLRTQQVVATALRYCEGAYGVAFLFEDRNQDEWTRKPNIFWVPRFDIPTWGSNNYQL